ncbi:MAG: hypothetical protein JXA71_07730, partial [Chitinispirillaceae bacterium]|nr:hypothetical protein [Chitinispirillaceae bacterium]
MIFSANSGSGDPAIAGEAYRGLSEVDSYLGNDSGACRNFFISYCKDGNELYVSCPLMKVAEFSRMAWGRKMKEGYRVIGLLAKTPGLFSGQSQEDLAARHLNDGNVKKATSIIRDMGCILDWQYIGPFDNISHSGYNRIFPPETEIDFTKSYPGKDGNRAKWHSLVSAPTSPWIFVENHLPVSNAVNYFYSAIASPADQEALLAFGASGMFKVLLNGTVVIADSIFRNTGSDMFIQRVKLFKGSNPLLIKLGHEWGTRSGDDVKLSNFSLRFLDKKYAPLKNLKVSLQPAKAAPATEAPVDVRPQPIVDSVVTVLGSRLKKNPDDVDAALLLMHFYNGTESTDDNQKLLRSWIRRYPKSALLHMLLRESLWRAKKHTEAQTVAKTAYRAAPDQIGAWTVELSTIAASGDAQRIVRFIEQSPPHCRSSFTAEYQLLTANVSLNNRNAVLDGLARLEKNHRSNSLAVSILASSFVEQGNVGKAKKTIETYLKHDRTSTDLYQTLSQIALKSGNINLAVRTITTGLVYKPIDANAWFYLSKLALYAKKHAEALTLLEKAEAIMPASSAILNLKGSVLEAASDNRRAEQAYADAIAYTSDDFNAWDNLRRMKDKPGLDSLAPLPSIESLLKNSASWDRRDFETGAILGYIDDIFYYPSRCSKERQFLAVYLGTQKAIDNWKEYQCGYNSNFQTCVIDRALTLKADGNQVPADQNENQVVFKSLQPGDAILIEWTLKNYYSGEMAQQVWGETPFQLNSPVFDQRLRLVTPQ